MLNRWEVWFAWRPVWINGHGPVWLKRIERMKKIHYSLAGGAGEYPAEIVLSHYRMIGDK